MWRFIDWPRFTFPVAVSLKRFFAPRWRVVFSFAFGFLMIPLALRLAGGSGGRLRVVFLRLRLLAFRGTGGLLAGLLRLRDLLLGRQDLDHRHAFLPRGHLDQGDLGELGGQARQDPVPDLAVYELAAAEDDGGLHLVPVLQEPLGVAALELEVVLVDLGPELQLLDDDVLLVLARLGLTLVLLIEELSRVHDAAHR